MSFAYLAKVTNETAGYGRLPPELAFDRCLEGCIVQGTRQ